MILNDAATCDTSEHWFQWEYCNSGEHWFQWEYCAQSLYLPWELILICFCAQDCFILLLYSTYTCTCTLATFLFLCLESCLYGSGGPALSDCLGLEEG